MRAIPVFPVYNFTFSELCNHAAVGSESPACHKLIAIQVHTAAQLIYKMTWGRETRCHVPLFQLEQSFWFVFTVWHSAFQFIWNTQEQWEEFARKHTHPFHISPRSTYSVHNNSTPQILLFQKILKKSHLISHCPMKQWRVRGKWTINLCNVIHGLSVVSKCLHRHPSKPAVKRILQKRNLSRAGLSLYLSPARQQQGIKHIIFQRSVHFSYRLAFYVLCTPAQGRTAVWAPHPL